MNELIVFQGIDIRRTLYNNEWYFCVEDVVQVLTESSNVKDYIKKMRKRDVLKFVVGSQDDLEQAKLVFQKYYSNLRNRIIYVSPVFGKIEPKDIVEFIKKNHLVNWRTQIQLHKVIWEPSKRGV